MFDNWMELAIYIEELKQQDGQDKETFDEYKLSCVRELLDMVDADPHNTKLQMIVMWLTR